MAIEDMTEAGSMNAADRGGFGGRTRIREFRKLRGLTLKELAFKINTTPQTVQRLETANMTVSTAWLQKIALALHVEPMDLLGSRSAHGIPLIGRIDESGRVSRGALEAPSLVQMEVPADDPIAVRLETAVGSFDAGMVLIANRFRPEDIENAHGLDCIVAVADGGPTLLRRVVRGRMPKTWTLIPPGNGGEVQYDRSLSWAARIIMALRYF